MNEERLQIRLAKTKARLDQIVQARQKREAARVEKKRADLEAKKHKLGEDIKKLRARFLRNLTEEQLGWYKSERKQSREEASRRRAKNLLDIESAGYSKGWRAREEKARPWSPDDYTR
ncbi:MAG: hypothetical protein Athens041674_212 [Parcubacteria group bacterium Athens0416_74]|nr:MAG: hypothetical protein Athens041674_212 [Parcubacteria group bacterium Athens0416_74]